MSRVADISIFIIAICVCLVAAVALFKALIALVALAAAALALGIAMIFSPTFAKSVNWVWNRFQLQS